MKSEPESTITVKRRSHRGLTQISKSKIGCQEAGRIGYGVREEELHVELQKAWLAELISLLKDSVLIKIVEELAAGYKLSTVRRHCNLKIAEWRLQIARLQRAIHALLFESEGDAVLIV